MSLISEIESLKEQIEEAKKREEGVVEEPEEVAEEEQEPEQEEKAEESPKEEEKPEEKPEQKKEPELDDQGYARLRREKAAAQKQAEQQAAEVEALRRELELLRNGGDAQEVEQPEIAPEITEILQDHRVSRAEREFLAIESQFKASTPDYNAVAAEYTQALMQSIRIKNPRMPQAELAERTKMEILQIAGEYVRQGFNPVEEMYHTAKELGYTGKSFMQQPQAEEKPAPKPDMARVAANRQRSAGMAGSGGEGRGQMTKEFAATQLTNDEWSRLSVEEKKRLLRG